MEVGTKSIAGGFDDSGAYQVAFGKMNDRTMYVNTWQKSDAREQLNKIMKKGLLSLQKKALSPTTGGAGTAGYALVPIYVDPRLVDVSRKYTPLVELIPRVSNMGLTADYSIITAKGDAYTAGADGALPDVDDSYERGSVSIKFLYAVGRVLGPMQAAMPSYMIEGFNPNGSGMGQGNFSPVGAPNAKQTDVLLKARALKELEENLILNGDADTTATQFSGIVKLQATTNQRDLASAPLTWLDVEKSVQDAFDDGGRPKIAVASSSVVVDLRQIMIDMFRIAPSTDSLPFGIPTAIGLQTMCGVIPLIPSMFLSNVSGAKQIYFLDTDFIEMRVLQDMTYQELAQTNDSKKYMLKIYEALTMRATQFNSFVDNIQ